MHGFPVDIIVASFGGNAFSQYAWPDALVQERYSEKSQNHRVCRASPVYAQVIHIFMKE